MPGPGQGGESSGVPAGFCERCDQPQLIRVMNERNAALYAERQKRLETQLTAETLKVAFMLRESEIERGVTIHKWSFEKGIEDAAKVLVFLRKEFGRAGGRSP